jgi:enamine deaminase RidA (YjgF/YER057c/UK114 family)
MALFRKTASSGSPYEPQIGFSRALRVGDYVAVSATAAIGDEGSTVGVGDMYVQTVRCLDIAERALTEVGASIDDVVRTRVMVTDVSRWAEAARAHAERFANVRPASTFVEVTGCIDPRLADRDRGGRHRGRLTAVAGAGLEIRPGRRTMEP